MRRVLFAGLLVLLAGPAWAQNFTCTLANVCTFSGSQSLWPAGSLAAPSIAASTDTDTGIRFPAAGQISFVLDGTQRVLFDASGFLANVTYFNFSTTSGTTGYGFRDNSGTMQFKDSGGAWTNIAAAANGAPLDATYVTQTANASLTNEQALSALASGIMRVATTTGVVTSLTASADIAANLSDETGSGLLVFGTSPTLTTPTFSGAIAGSPTTSGTWTFANAGFGIYDTDSTHALRLVPGSNLTAARNLTLTTGDAARTITINGDTTLNAWFDQDVRTTATPSFTGATLTGNLLFTDALYDIGASGATRPRDLFLSRNATIGGTLGVTGVTTLTGALVANGNTTLGDAVGDTVTVTGMFAASSLRVADTNASHALVITPGSNITADRVLTLTTGDAARTVTINGNTTVDQDVSTTGNPTFAALTVTSCTGCSGIKGYTATIADVSNTASETDFCTITVPANDMAAGDVLYFVGTYLVKNNKGSAGGPTIKAYWGAATGTVEANTTAWDDNATERSVTIVMVMHRVGTTLYVQNLVQGAASRTASFLANLTAQGNGIAITGVTFTSSQTVKFSATLSAADATFYLKPQSINVYKVAKV